LLNDHGKFLDPDIIGMPSDLQELLYAAELNNSSEPNVIPKVYKDSLDRIANIVYTDLEGVIVYASQLFCETNKCSLDYAIGKTNSEFKSDFHTPDFYKTLWKEVKSGKIWRGEFCNRAMDGTIYWADTKIAPRYDAHGRMCGYIAFRLDITARKEAEVQAAKANDMRLKAEALLNDVVETLPNGVIAYDKDGEVIFFNKALKEIFGQVAQGVELGHHRQDIISQVEQAIMLSKTYDGTKYFTPNASFETHLQRLPNGRWLKVQNRRSSTGTIVSVQTDVTDLKRIEQQMMQQAERDSLTGLFNRHAMFEHLRGATSQSKDTIQPCTLILLDLDDFKAVNDGMGHDAGDALLCHVAKSLESAVKKTDIVARIGGDEFAILLTDTSSKSEFKYVMEDLFAALKESAQIGQNAVNQSASMGAASFPCDGKTPQELMKSADLALYQCKHDSRGGYKVYNARMRRQSVRRSILLDKLRLALKHDEFQVALQPQCAMSNGHHTGFEALVRWKVGRKWIPPEDLISIAEEAGLITQLSTQVIGRAFAMMARLKSSGLNPAIIGINVVAAQLLDPNFVDDLMGLSKKHCIRPSEIEIEVTENVILDRSARKIECALRTLHSKGVSIALDDFGMGYASLKHLRRFPLNRLKIDRSFVSDLLEDEDDHVIVRTIISLAHSLGLQVVAEGIETFEQYQELVKLRCDVAQGFLIARPLDEEGAIEWCKNSIFRSVGHAPDFTPESKVNGIST